MATFCNWLRRILEVCIFTSIGKGILLCLAAKGVLPEVWVADLLNLVTESVSPYAAGWLLAGIFGLLGMMLWESRGSIRRAAHEPQQFACSFDTLDLLCRLLPQLRDDATGYMPHQPEMLDRLRELQSQSAVFAGAGLTSEYQWFFNYVGDAIVKKSSYISPADRDDVRKRIDEAYPVLKAALDQDYAKRRANRL